MNEAEVRIPSRSVPDHNDLLMPVVDPRDVPVTVTMLASEWDALMRVPYAYSDYSLADRAKAKLAAAVPGQEERHAAAQAHVDVLRPDVLGALDLIEDRFGLLVDWWENGPRDGISHLGAGAPHQQAIESGPHKIFPWVMRDVPHLGLRLPEVSFAGTYPYLRFTDAERDAIAERLSRVRPVDDTWSGGANISLRFVPACTPPGL